MIRKLRPLQPDPYIKLPGDQEIAKFGHLNWLINQINLIPPGGITSVVGGTDISVDITDPLNPIINYTGGGGGGDLEQTLTLGDDANQLSIQNLNNLEAVSMTDVSGAGFTATYAGGYILHSGAQINIDAGGDVIFGALTGLQNIDASALVQFLTVGGAGVRTDNITELTPAAGVTIAGTGGLYAEKIEATVGNITAAGAVTATTGNIDAIAGNLIATAGNITALLGYIETGDPGGGIGQWRLGQLTAGAVALDATQYIEVEVDSVVYKLLISS